MKHKKKKRGEKVYYLSGYRGMWLFALFDLPVKTAKDRKEYALFRKELLKQGFTMLQFSVYARYCCDEQKGDLIRNHLRLHVPPHGQVRFVMITDHQFGKMEVFQNEKLIKTEEPPPQLLLF